MMKLALFSDCHAAQAELIIPAADILLFAGDMAHCRTARDVKRFNDFLGSLPHAYKVVIGGNHDHELAVDPLKAKTMLSNAVYLQDEAVEVDGITIYGSPWQPTFNSYACDAFALPRGQALKEKWAMIPPGVDILLTHTPPMGILDQDGPVGHGCSDLAAAVAALKPRYHIFGHIHSQHGMITLGPTSYINCNVQAGNGVLRPALLLDYDAGKLLEFDGRKA